METPAFPRGRVCGLRKLTTNHLIAARLAEQAHGLPDGVKHPNQLLAALRRAAASLGYRRLLPLMEELFRWTQTQDWAPDGDPVVWPGNETLAAALDCSERHVSRLIAAAIDARLIAARDGSDRKRRGFRENGRIVWACGLSLRPMASRYAEFLQAARDSDAARQACRAMRRQGCVARQAIAQLIDLAARHHLPPDDLAAFHRSALDLTGKLRKVDAPARGAELVSAIEALRNQATQWVERALETGDMSGSPDSEVRDILPTNERSRLEVAAAEKVPASPPLKLAPAEFVRLAPRLGGLVPGKDPAWCEISDAAAMLAWHLGISHALYGEACQTLGRVPAAIAIGIISARPPAYFHTAGPAGYLRGMLRRAACGELHLDRSIFGLRDAREKLTAVNSLPKGMGKCEIRRLMPN